jgi:outer membrane protein assembly factor BamA
VTALSIGGGLGFLLKKSLDLELTYELEWMNIKSQAEFSPLESSSALKPALRKLELAATLDTLDNRRDPRNGLLFRGLYEGSYESLGSQVAYDLAEASLLVHFKLMANVVLGLKQRWSDITYSPGTLLGTGVGVVIKTPLGLLEFVYGLGSKGPSDPNTL